MASLDIKSTGEIAAGGGQLLSAGGVARWVVVLHTNSAEIRVGLAPEQQGQHPMLVMPKRAENLFSLLSDSVEEELELAFVLRGLSVDCAAIKELATALGLADLSSSRPEDLSGGQKARLALAVLLLRRPETIVLDNALDAIDESSRSAVAALLRRAVDGGTRLIELTAASPLDPDQVDEALFEEGEGWECAARPDMLGRMRQWGVAVLPAAAPRPSSQCAVLHGSGLAFGYPGGFRLKVPGFRVCAGEILWVVGPNGAGKTTLLKCLALLLRPEAGILHFDRGDESLKVDFGKAGGKLDPVHRFALYQFQDPDDQIYCESVQEELVATARQCRGIDDGLFRKYSEQLGLSGRLSDSPWDLHRSARRLLTLGSILCAAPAVALLDEPTVELDASQKSAAAAALADFVGTGGACVVISHDSQFMQAICTSRLDVREGEVMG